MITEKQDPRQSPVEMAPDEFRHTGYKLIDSIADFLEELPSKPVSSGVRPIELQRSFKKQSIPEIGEDANRLLKEAADLIFNYTTFNGHPKFWGYVTSSATPIGALGDLLAASVNPNMGAWNLSPVATEIESQSISWIAEMIDYPADCGGIMVSGGNMANFVGFLAARSAKADWEIRKEGLNAKNSKQLLIYASTETHTWIQKAADLFGFGTDSIRWIDVGNDQKMLVDDLENKINLDKDKGYYPFIVIGNAGTVGTGAVDPLQRISAICKKNNLWFHVDGAYGAFVAAIPYASEDVKALKHADSIALDPHKWLYTPLEAGCALVRDSNSMLNAFSYHPTYYRFADEKVEEDRGINYYEYGLQNSRGFRALKVWLGLKQVGRNGYIKMIEDDIKLSEHLFQLVKSNNSLQAVSQHLSITTFRYVPPDIELQNEGVEEYLNELNQELLDRLNRSGEAYISNAMIDGKFLLRACIVNFRTTYADIDSLPGIVTRIGKEVDDELRQAKFNAIR
jgi:glutamate/tyrosine decarboxylase-like PLP-dependent enzyme